MNKTFKILAALFYIIYFFDLGICNAQNIKTSASTADCNSYIENPKKLSDIYIYDYENILTDGEEKRLSEIIINFKEQTKKEILVVTTFSIGKFPDIHTYAKNLGNVYTGEAEEKNIVIIAISKSLKKLAIATSDNARNYLTDEICKNIIEQVIIPKLKKGDYFIGIKEGVNSLIKEWTK